MRRCPGDDRRICIRMEKHFDHLPDAPGVVRAERLGPPACFFQRHPIFETLEGIDADNALRSAGHKQGCFDGNRAAERVAEQDEVAQCFGIGDRLDVSTELGNSPLRAV
jgi:hypothetical protein